MWLQHMPSVLTTTTGTFHNPNEQHVYRLLLTESRLSPSVLSQGNPFGFTHLQSSWTSEQPCLPSRGKQNLRVSLWPPLHLSFNKTPP